MNLWLKVARQVAELALVGAGVGALVATLTVTAMARHAPYTINSNGQQLLRPVPGHPVVGPPAPAAPPPAPRPTVGPPFHPGGPLPAPSPAIGSDGTDRELMLINSARAAAGVAPVRLDGQLTQAAQAEALYMGMAGFYAHNAPNGSTPLSRMVASGFPGTGWWGENIAAAYPDPDSVMAAFLASPDHRANILNPAFTDVGLGVADVPQSQWGWYWVQDFAQRRGH